MGQGLRLLTLRLRCLFPCIALFQQPCIASTQFRQPLGQVLRLLTLRPRCLFPCIALFLQPGVPRPQFFQPPLRKFFLITRRLFPGVALLQQPGVADAQFFQALRQCLNLGFLLTCRFLPRTALVDRPLNFRLQPGHFLGVAAPAHEYLARSLEAGQHEIGISLPDPIEAKPGEKTPKFTRQGARHRHRLGLWFFSQQVQEIFHDLKNILIVQNLDITRQAHMHRAVCALPKPLPI